MNSDRTVPAVPTREQGRRNEGDDAGPRVFSLAAWRTVRYPLAVLLMTAGGRFLDGWEADELHHLHCAWLVGQGLIPYRDYFDHHMPLFQFIFAPLAALVGTHYVWLFVVSRLIALAAMLLGGLAFGRLATRGTGADLVPLALCLFVTARANDYMLLLRPDFIALTCMLVAAALALQRPRLSVEQACVVGLLVGISILLTQKSVALVPAFVLWSAMRVVRSADGGERLPWWVPVAVLCCIAVPLAIAVAWLCWAGALAAFWSMPVTMVAHWHQRTSTALVLQEPVLLGFPLLAVGLGGAIVWSARFVRHGCEETRGDGLLGLLAIFGFLGFLRTPAPSYHGFVFTSQVWILVCGVGTAGSVVRALTGSAPNRRTLLAAIVFVGIGLASLLRPYNIAVVVFIWVPLLAALLRYVRLSPASADLSRRALAAVAVPTVLVCLGNVVERVIRHSVVPQLSAMALVDHLVPPGTRVLTAWPVVTSARPHAMFHWAGDEGVYATLPTAMMRAEYMRALTDQSVSVVAWEPRHVYRYIPDLRPVLEASFTEVPLSPRQKRSLGVCVYVRRLPGASLPREAVPMTTRRVP